MGWPRVNPGDKLRIPADLHNATIEAVEAHIRNKTATGGQATAQRPRQATIYVRNDSGADIAQGGVLGLSEPVWPGYRTYPKPTVQGLNQFLGAEILFLGVMPAEADHAGKFAIAIEPIPSGAVGRACVQGVVRVRVKIDIEDPAVADWADVTGGELNFLTAATSGSARILWHEPGTAPDPPAAIVLWAICLIGAEGGGQAFPVEVTLTYGEAGGVDGDCTWVYNVDDINGKQIGTDMAPLTRRIPGTTYIPAQAGTYGLACYDDGVLKLLRVDDEKEAAEICDGEISGTINQGTWD